MRHATVALGGALLGLVAVVTGASSVPSYPKASAELRWMLSGKLEDQSKTVAWFEGLEDDGDPDDRALLGAEPPRTDFYLAPTDKNFAIKIRGPSEIYARGEHAFVVQSGHPASSHRKRSVHAAEGPEFVMELKRIAGGRSTISLSVGRSNGTVELWKKWSTKTTEQPPPNLIAFGTDADTSDFVTIRKSRRMKVFQCNASLPLLVEVELTSIQLFDGHPELGNHTPQDSYRDYWTLGFEASNPDRATLPSIPGGFATLKTCLTDVAQKRVFMGNKGEPRLSVGVSMGYAEWLNGVIQKDN